MSSPSPSSTSNHIDLCLTRITSLLERLGNPHHSFPVIHVAGTNGKGTTTVYLDEILSKVVGLRTGRFNSPHLIQRSDSCRVNGHPVPSHVWRISGEWVELADQRSLIKTELAVLTAKIASHSNRSVLPKRPQPSEKEAEGPLQSTPFEILTAQTLLSFSLLPVELKPEILIVEVGLGGRMDATNVFTDQQVLASVICPIDMDHQNVLGSTLREIASQKAGIIKKNGLVVVSDQRRQLAGDESETAAVDCTLISDEDVESRQIGREAAEILESIRSESTLKNARMVKGLIDWSVLNDASGSFIGRQDDSSSPATEPSGEPRENPWRSLISSRQTFSPTLFLPAPPPSDQGRNRSINTGLSSLFPPAKPSASGTAKPKVPTYKSSIGDVPIPGPKIQIPPTRASLTGSHTALQTLFSIARDEPPSAMGVTGSDELEELKLKIAFALRSEGNGERRLQQVLEGGVKLEGRADWKWLDIEIFGEKATDVPDEEQSEDDEVKMKGSVIGSESKEPLPESAGDQMQIDGTRQQEVNEPLQTDDLDASISRTAAGASLKRSLLFLLDGAHNPSSARALRSYVDTCVTAHLRSHVSGHSSSGLMTINWIIAFSQGKEIEETLRSLIQPGIPTTKPKDDLALAEQVQDMAIDPQSQRVTKPLEIRHRICFVPFKTPVEGMPWIQSVAPSASSEALRSLQSGLRSLTANDGASEEVMDIKECINLKEGLRWVAEQGGVDSGKVGMEMNVICGSLYLIGEVYSM